MNEKVKGLIQDLGNAINELVLGSEKVESIMQQIRDTGYEVYLMLEANIAVENKRSETELSDDRFTADDLEFLRRLKIEL